MHAPSVPWRRVAHPPRTGHLSSAQGERREVAEGGARLAGLGWGVRSRWGLCHAACAACAACAGLLTLRVAMLLAWWVLWVLLAWWVLWVLWLLWLLWVL